MYVAGGVTRWTAGPTVKFWIAEQAEEVSFEEWWNNKGAHLTVTPNFVT